MNLWVVCVALTFAIGCSDNPLGPTRLLDPAGPGGPALQEDAPNPALRWDVVAPGCSPQGLPSPLPDPATGRVRHEADQSITVSWDWSSPGGRPVVLYARFVQTGGAWALCYWDTADV